MDKPISSLMQRNLTVVDIDDAIEKVEAVLNSSHLSYVPVVDSEGKCFGVISAPDLMHFHRKGQNPKARHAWEVCTHKVIEASPDASLNEVVELMVNNHIHHLVITDKQSMLGIVSSIDLINECVLK
ncbi:CBS domain-containing protein [Thiohalomonas denitrificans]|nr:CBS domain-containing protein [Thiohalomonas denitrificans]